MYILFLISGASSGLGAGCAVEFAKHDNRLALTGRNRERLEQTAAECVAQGLDRDRVSDCVISVGQYSGWGGGYILFNGLFPFFWVIKQG